MDAPSTYEMTLVMSVYSQADLRHTQQGATCVCLSVAGKQGYTCPADWGGGGGGRGGGGGVWVGYQVGIGPTTHTQCRPAHKKEI